MLNIRHYVARSLVGHWKINLAVALAAAAATAVLIGALLVGDSVRGSLRDLVLDRLGLIDEVLVSDHFFRQELAEELRTRLSAAAEAPSMQSASARRQVAGAIILPQGSVESSAAQDKRRANQVLVLGVDDGFWEFFPKTPAASLSGNQVLLNQALADDLRIAAGDRVTLRLPAADLIPADSVMADKSDRIRGLAQLEVVGVLPNDGAGRFSLLPNQSFPRIAYVSLSRVQLAVRQADRINAILVSSTLGPQEFLQPRLVDYGLQWNRVRREAERGAPLDYFQLTSDRLTLSPEVLEAAEETLGIAGGFPLFTYLANRIERLDPQTGEPSGPMIPYSMVTGVPSEFTLIDASGSLSSPLSSNEVALNHWSAWQLAAQPGDKIRLTFFDPESAHGVAKVAHQDFVLRLVLPMAHRLDNDRPTMDAEPPAFASEPTLYNDAEFTPTVKGFTDQATIDDWDPPFPYNPRWIETKDDVYWEQHRTTPKAFVSLQEAQRLWGSRFGEVTSYRVPLSFEQDAGILEAALLEALGPRADALGMQFTAIRQRDLQSARGTTPFDVLFLLLSMFIIGAALMLVGLLFRLGVEQRASELGVLAAVGFSRRRALRMFLCEGLVVAGGGGLLGVGLGLCYAWLMLAGLQTWWSGAVVTPFMRLHVGPPSLIAGWLGGVACSLAAIWLTLRRVNRTSTRRLLAGQAEERRDWGRPAASWKARTGVVGSAIAAMILGYSATGLHGETQAGAFVASGALFLIAILILCWMYFRGGRASSVQGWSLRKLAGRNAGRNALRSTMTLGLVAIATFLIVSMSVFRLAPTIEGSGGFHLIAESSQPIFDDLNDPQVRRDVLLADADALEDSTVVAFRVRAGDDASCRNLYRATQPRVLGVTGAMIAYYDQQPSNAFNFASVARADGERPENPWSLLEGKLDGGAVPVILDNNTAMYSLQLYGGVGQEFSFAYDGRPIRFQIVGLLANSLLQGSLLISETRFLELFPDVGGYQMFLIMSSAARQDAASRALEQTYAPEGLDVRESHDVLADLLVVQNTYISTFQSLGMLGLLLGTFGLAAVQMRNIVERRGELALMRAIGFPVRRLAGLVMLENLALLLGGIGAGSAAAMLAVAPYWLIRQAGWPGGYLPLTLLVVTGVGVLSGLASVAAVLRAPLIAALREE